MNDFWKNVATGAGTTVGGVLVFMTVGLVAALVQGKPEEEQESPPPAQVSTQSAAATRYVSEDCRNRLL